MSAQRKPINLRTHKKRVAAEHRAKGLTERQITDAKNAQKKARHAAAKEKNQKMEAERAALKAKKSALRMKFAG